MLTKCGIFVHFVSGSEWYMLALGLQLYVIGWLSIVLNDANENNA
jgi:hypothetical protein